MCRVVSSPSSLDGGFICTTSHKSREVLCTPPSPHSTRWPAQKRPVDRMHGGQLSGLCCGAYSSLDTQRFFVGNDLCAQAQTAASRRLLTSAKHMPSNRDFAVASRHLKDPPWRNMLPCVVYCSSEINMKNGVARASRTGPQQRQKNHGLPRDSMLENRGASRVKFHSILEAMAYVSGPVINSALSDETTHLIRSYGPFKLLNWPQRSSTREPEGATKPGVGVYALAYYAWLHY